MNPKKYLLFQMINIGIVATCLVAMIGVYQAREWISLNYIYFAVPSAVLAGIMSIYLVRRKELILRNKRILIIYSRKDREVAAMIVERLRADGFNPWFDVDEIVPGQIWPDSMKNGLAKSAVSLFLVSKNVNEKSKYVAEELKLAKSLMRSRDDSFSPIIPVRLDDSSVPKELNDIHWVDFDQPDSYEQLKKGLMRVLGISEK